MLDCAIQIWKLLTEPLSLNFGQVLANWAMIQAMNAFFYPSTDCSHKDNI